MRGLFIVLLLANVAFFGYMRLNHAGTGEPMSAHEPFNADKVHLLGLAPPPTAKPRQAATPQVCLEWGSFAGAQLERARQALDKLQLGDKLVQRDQAESASYWVIFPPFKTRQDAEKKMAEVKALDIEDVALVQENGKVKNVVSLGVFSTREAADKYLALVREKGVRSARIEAHAKGTVQTTFLIKDASEALSAELVKIKQDFAESELKAVACDSAAKPQNGEKK